MTIRKMPAVLPTKAHIARRRVSSGRQLCVVRIARMMHTLCPRVPSRYLGLKRDMPTGAFVS